MTPFSKNALLVLCNIVVWTVNSSVLSGKIALFAKKGIPVTVDVTPSRIRLSVNGTAWRGGAGAMNGWVQTPAQIHLAPGQHKLTVERPGYAPHTFKVLINEGDDSTRLTSELEMTSDATSTLEITTNETQLQTATIIVDQGLEIGVPPLLVRDLVPGMHILEVRRNQSDNTTSKPFLCTFSIPAPASSTHKINLSINGGRIQASNCQRLRKLK